MKRSDSYVSKFILLVRDVSLCLFALTEMLDAQILRKSQLQPRILRKSQLQPRILRKGQLNPRKPWLCPPRSSQSTW